MKKFPVVMTLALGLAVALPGALRAAELVAFVSTTCDWCESWERDIGVVYDKTDEGRMAPVRRVQLHDTRPADLEKVRGVVYTPTFVLMDRGREVGRITGYPGEANFWGLLDEMLGKLKAPAQTAAGCPKDNVKSC